MASFMLYYFVMRNVLFLICAVTLFTAGLASVAYADMPNMVCSHHVSADVVCVDSSMQDQTDLEQCQDCCCAHSHVFAGTLFVVSVNDTFKGNVRLDPHTHFRSNDQPPLYRPPIA